MQVIVRKKFLVINERRTDDVNDSVGTAEKKFSINLNKSKTKFCLSLHYNGNSSYLLIEKKRD